MKYIKLFDQINLNDVAQVGGKNASIGQLTILAKEKHIKVPAGFATTSDAYWYFIAHNNLKKQITILLTLIKNTNDTKKILSISKKIRELIEHAEIPHDLQKEIIEAYQQLSGKRPCFVALRSSATAEDLPHASFAGQHESFLYIKGQSAVLKTWLRCVSSLFTPRAIVYRMINHIAHEHVALSVGIQHMVHAQSSGVAFTIDTESGFKNVVSISAVYGLGETLVQGIVNPDEYYVHKDLLSAGFSPLLTKTCGDKNTMALYTNDKVQLKKVLPAQRNRFCLTDNQILELARQCIAIEQQYSKHYGHWTPMDIEWAKTPNNNLYIVQARPETIHSKNQQTIHTIYHLGAHKQHTILTGQAIGQKIGQGNVFISTDVKHAAAMPLGSVLVTSMTNPDWVPIMKRAAAIITDSGSRTCHAAIVSRELGIPAAVGTQHATTTLKNKQPVTIDCSTGSMASVYQGLLPITRRKISFAKLPKPPIPIMINVSVPARAFSLAALPVAGVGLARTEFIIANTIRVHPLALIHYKKLPIKTQVIIKEITAAYTSPKEFFVQVLAQQWATIAAAFWPKPVLIRLSDFKSNEYRDLIGGEYFEDLEQNPMLGKRGAFRYYGTPYKEAFALECAAHDYARTIKGFTNIQLMIPMIRSTHEAKIIHQVLKKTGLLRMHHQPKRVFMCETPAAALQTKELAKFCDSFSIGSNDLAQFTLAVDREDEALAHAFNEQNPAILQLISHAIAGAHKAKKTIGICGQAPSDSIFFRDWIIRHKIDYLSLNPDAVIPFLQDL